MYVHASQFTETIPGEMTSDPQNEPHVDTKGSYVRASQLTETIPGETRASHKLISVLTHSKMYHTND